MCGVEWKCMQGGCGEYKFQGKSILRTDLKETGWEGVDWINLAQDEDSSSQLSQL